MSNIIPLQGAATASRHFTETIRKKLETLQGVRQVAFYLREDGLTIQGTAKPYVSAPSHIYLDQAVFAAVSIRDFDFNLPPAAEKVCQEAAVFLAWELGAWDLCIIHEDDRVLWRFNPSAFLPQEMKTLRWYQDSSLELNCTRKPRDYKDIPLPRRWRAGQTIITLGRARDKAQNVPPTPHGILYLNVPYAKNAYARRNGARWCQESRSWYTHSPLADKLARFWDSAWHKRKTEND